MGVAAAVLLFVSVLLHELSHSLVAKAKRISVDSITLFFFGGVAGLSREDLPARGELEMALAGPLFSLLFSGALYLVHSAVPVGIISTVTAYLYQINFMLAIFNLIPGYPLDGGRALRALLHAYYHDLKKATKIASRISHFIAVVMVVVGIITLFNGGLWLILIGGFLYFVSKAGYEQVLLKETLNKIPITEVMRPLIMVKSDLLFEEFLQKYSCKDTDFFLVKDKQFIGLLDVRLIGKNNCQLRELAVPVDQMNSVSYDNKSYAAFQFFLKQKLGVVAVKKNNKVIGFVTKEVLMHYLNWTLKYGPLTDSKDL